MATDGVKIIDGDTAHDTYWGIMDLYDSGAEFETINKEFPLTQFHFDDFENEIYATSCALALWEIGLMSADNLAYIKTIIDKEAGISEWSQEDKKAGIARKKALDSFWSKISQTNEKVRARKKYRKISNLYFQPDDLLTFQLRDCSYRAVICTTINQYRGHCYYNLTPTTYISSKKPVVDDLLDEGVLGNRIGSGYDIETTKKMQPGIEKIWNLPGEYENFFFGLAQLAVDHKDFINIKDKFEKIGALKIAEGLKRMGSFGYAEDFERFQSDFGDLDNRIKLFRQNKYPIRILCEL